MNTRRTFLVRGLGAAGLVGLAGRSARGWEEPPAAGPKQPDAAKAVEFLRSRQSADGSWSGDRVPGITALVVAALIRSGRVQPDDPAIVRGLGFLEKHLDPKGGMAGDRLSVYSTAVALMAFNEANVGGKYDAIVKGCQDYLRGAQYDEGEGKSREDPHYGGLGYGDGKSRPDLSNTAFMIEALRDSGVPADDPALQKALLFVSRCQNLESEFNDQPWAGKINDGGFIYTSGAVAPPPGRAGGGREAEAAGGGIPSTAGMTYSGLKSMLYAGLKPDDVRVKAATDYIKKNYTLDENPGQGQRGLYYYYMVFARAMAALGAAKVVDADGDEHDWRADLSAALGKRQETSGGWVNNDDRFMEGDPNIVTSYVLIALAAK